MALSRSGLSRRELSRWSGWGGGGGGVTPRSCARPWEAGWEGSTGMLSWGSPRLGAGVLVPHPPVGWPFLPPRHLCDPEPSPRPRTPRSSRQDPSLGSQCQGHSGRGSSQCLIQLLVLSIRGERALSPSAPGAFRQSLWSHSWGRTPAGQQSPASAQEGGLGGFQDDARGPPRMEVPASGLTGWGAW